MKRASFYTISSLASIGLLALVASFAQAGPSSGGHSYQYRAGAGSSASYSVAGPVVVSGSFTPLFNPEPVLYAYYTAPSRAPGAGGEEESEAFAGQPASANIEMTVPASAQVWVDGHQTSQVGGTRAFVTPPLERGKTYSYDLRVRWVGANGLVIDVTRPIHVKAGRQTMVGFSQ